MKLFNELVLAAVNEGYSDLHISGGQPLVVRKQGAVHFDTRLTWSHEDVDSLVKALLNERQLAVLRKRWSVDFAMTVSHVRIRVNAFNTIRGLSLAIRLLSGSVPTLSKLNLHPSLQEICQQKAGLVLICGATGCGKSTTIAALINEINLTRAAHIITLEDPIEYRFPSVKAFIEQRELGVHMPSFQQGLFDVLREDPDVIVVGELRDPETIRLTLNAAEAGHLVIATLHATNVEDAIYRIINASPLEVQEQIRFQIASTLSWIIIQQLVFLEKIKFRVPLLSILKGIQAIKGIIRENRLPQLENALHTGRNEGMFTLERYLNEYLNTRTSFIHPSQVFKPSEEDTREIVYNSPVVLGDDAISPTDMGNQVLTSGTVTRRTGRPQKGKSPLVDLDRYDGEEGDQHYTIDEEANLEELIAQIDHRK